MEKGKRLTIKSSGYPRYDFFRKRLQDLVPRCQRILDAGKLPGCIEDGVNKLKDIVSNTMYFQDDVTVYLFHKENEYFDYFTLWHLVGRKTPDKSLLVNSEIGTLDDLIDELKSFHVCQPIVAVMQREFPLPDVDFRLRNLTKEQKGAFFFCGSYTVVGFMHLVVRKYNEEPYIETVSSSSAYSLSRVAFRIQDALEGKVISVLVKIAQYIQPLVPHCPEELKKTLYESLYDDIHDSLNTPTVITKFFPRPEEETKTAAEKNKIFQNNLVDFVVRKTKSIFCDKFSIKFDIRPDIMEKFLNEGLFNLEKKIISMVWSLPLPQYEEGISLPLLIETLKKLMPSLGTIFKTIIDEAEKFLLSMSQILEKLFQLQFELYGILRLAKDKVTIDIPTLKEIQKDLQKKLLDIDGVIGCGTIYGILTIHVKETTAQQKEKILEVLQAFGHQERYKCQVLETREEHAGEVESGQYLRARCSAEEEYNPTHMYGSLGCFVEVSPRDPNVDEKSKPSEPDPNVLGASKIEEKEVHAITCAHCFKDCVDLIEVKSGENFVRLGTKKHEIHESILDVATIAVDPLRQTSCDSKLKRFDESYTNEWHCYPGNPVSRRVHKEGPVTKFTKGTVISADYASKSMGSDKLDEFRQEILIEGLPDVVEGTDILSGPVALSGADFSQPGDSGSVICTDNADDDSVFIVSLLTGSRATYRQFSYTTSCKFEDVLEELKRRYNVEIKPAKLNGHPPINL